MSIPVTEDFTGVAAALAGVWTQEEPASGTVNKNGANHGIASVNALDLYAYRNDRTFSPNQCSQARVFSGLVSGAQFIQLTVRASGQNATAKDYEFYTDGVSGAGHSEIARRVANVPTVLGNIATTFTSLDVIRLIALDTGTGKVLLTVLKNGVSVGSVTDSSASIISSGAPGVGVFGNTVLIDDWEGWDLPIISTGIPYKGMNDVGFLLEDNSGFILTE